MRAAIRVSVSGLLRGRELAGEALAALEEEALALVLPRERIVLPVASLEGARAEGTTLALFVAQGDVVQLGGGPELEGLARELAQRALALPELTLSMRAMGSRHGAPGAEHDRWFAPLIAARRAAERAARPDGVRGALDAAALRDALTGVLRALAAERYPDDPPERRALEAELMDTAEDLLRRVARLERAQAALAASADEERWARWRAWVQALRDAYAGADACWLPLAALLGPERRGTGAHGRRWLGARGGRRRS
ncbi:MAG TPA: hypothetical protein VFS44_10840 [Gemmatimonadaceae bacterium]|nr:hypothetical protein [Gemmatimonadaceae bacterium]